MLNLRLKLISIILLSVTLFFVSYNSEVSAQKNDDIKIESKIDKKLLKLGYPERLLQNLSLVEKQEIANRDDIQEYAGATTTYFNANNQITSVDDYTSSSAPFTTFGTINSMTVTQLTSRLVNTSNLDRFELRTTHAWTISPVYRLTDYLGFAWDSSKFSLVPGTHVVSTGGSGPSGPASYTSQNLYSSGSGGVAFSFPLHKTGTRPATMARLDIQEKQVGSGTEQFHSLYTHVKSGSGSIGFSFVVNVSFTGTVSNDQRATTTNFSY